MAILVITAPPARRGQRGWTLGFLSAKGMADRALWGETRSYKIGPLGPWNFEVKEVPLPHFGCPHHLHENVLRQGGEISVCSFSCLCQTSRPLNWLKLAWELALSPQSSKEGFQAVTILRKPLWRGYKLIIVCFTGLVTHFLGGHPECLIWPLSCGSLWLDVPTLLLTLVGK